MFPWKDCGKEFEDWFKGEDWPDIVYTEAQDFNIKEIARSAWDAGILASFTDIDKQ